MFLYLYSSRQEVVCACSYLACCFCASVKLDGDFRAKLSLNPPQWHGYGHDLLMLMFLGGKQTFSHDEKSCKTSQHLAREHLFIQPCSCLHHAGSSQGDRGDLRNSAIRSHSLLTTRNNTGQVARCNIRLIIPSAASVSSCNSKCGATIDTWCFRNVVYNIKCITSHQGLATLPAE